MTVDVEDYFHASALASAVAGTDPERRESRVERNTHRLLELFDIRGVRATFFVLGWVAERFPALVSDIATHGHEIACHGFSHELIYNQKRDEFVDETRRALDSIQAACGARPKGYRAASYSVTKSSVWALEVLAELGFEYDSSIVPARHDLYGIVGAPSAPYTIELGGGKSIFEFPPSTISLLGYRLPIGGGGYFRIFPYAFSRWGMRRVNRAYRQPFAFYLHPWEIDPGQPRLDVPLKSRFRHYRNLEKFEPRLESLLEEFSFAPMGDVIDGLRGGAVESCRLAELAAS